MSGTYYNEIDLNAAAWLRELIRAGQIPDGAVDTRSITVVAPEDLQGFQTCHFFAGIGGWAYALQLAGWPADRPVWTGSCPCQPFSSAGKGAGAADPRHLWPAWFRLIAQCRPPVVFGEQVEAAIAHGWLDLVQADVEGEGYAFGWAGLPAAGVGAPHIRGRVWFVAESESAGGRANAGAVRAGAAAGIRDAEGQDGGRPSRKAGDVVDCSTVDTERLAFPEGQQHHRSGNPRRGRGESPDAGQLGHPPLGGLGIDRRTPGDPGYPDQPVTPEQLGHPHHPRPQGRGLHRAAGSGNGTCERPAGPAGPDGPEGAVEYTEGEQMGLPGCAWEPRDADSGLALPNQPLSGDGGLQRGRGLLQPPSDAPAGFWSPCSWLPCIDGKSRPVEPGTFPLAHGVPARVGRLRGYGNAIVPEVAEVFIRAYLDASKA